MVIKAKVLLEVAGFPKEHVEKTIRSVLEEIPKREYKILDQEILPTKERDEMFTSLAEATIECSEVETLYGFCFDFMPASVDIIEPETINLGIQEFNNSLNDLLATLHKLDQMLKNSNARTKVLTKNLNALTSNFVLNLLENDLTLKQLATKLGIPEDLTEKFLGAFEQQNLIKKEGKKYSKK
ncbi:hypothetical protein HN592_00385 [Candidatus Woesearchaeota archaeon]|jgi:hypothetical protein|nr:hypothetical protein [Candidatus Woesearchaeota archaeon]MBT4368764.1 hypothetical protein [Candidatus Woesearchaeota archaeon]MBT4712053.1 hypothetical protein [Candidatus Woesearchaeota archaeon]MBT6639199.1 hypothetical protein [Candidatus Woesearchaeota archaeon]MBT7134399.1 hypothetical protein [Candidatus Woesearchaeota archaeon]